MLPELRNIPKVCVSRTKQIRFQIPRVTFDALSGHTQIWPFTQGCLQYGRKNTTTQACPGEKRKGAESPTLRFKWCQSNECGIRKQTKDVDSCYFSRGSFSRTAKIRPKGKGEKCFSYWIFIGTIFNHLWQSSDQFGHCPLFSRIYIYFSSFIVVFYGDEGKARGWGGKPFYHSQK